MCRITNLIDSYVKVFHIIQTAMTQEQGRKKILKSRGRGKRNAFVEEYTPIMAIQVKCKYIVARSCFIHSLLC